MKIYETKKRVYFHIDEKWSIDLVDMIDQKTSNNKSFRHIFVVTDNCSKCTWCTPLKSKNAQTMTDQFSIFLIKSTEA